ncbi:MAG: hypothetical protein SX243_02730 [Acidobacteriota bacterium]|nr:hypothetical protein [Acidobacteriota bacterium]
MRQSTYGRTPTHREQLEIANSELATFREELERLQAEASELARELLEQGAPWYEGEPLPD